MRSKRLQSQGDENSSKRRKVKQEVDVKVEKQEDSAVSDDNDHELSYEEYRQKNIEEKMKMLESLNFDNLKQNLNVTSAKAKKKEPSRRGMKMKKEPVILELRPKSLRLQGKKADLSEASLAANIIATQNLYSENSFVVPSGPLEFHKALRDGDDPKLAEDFALKLKSLHKVEESKPENVSLTEMKKKLKSLKINENLIAKVVPSRIFSMAIHPSADRTLVFAGDKKGHLGMWDVDSENEQDGVYVYRPHSRPLNCLKFSLTDPTKLFSLGYCGTMRRCDLNQSVFEEVFTVPEDERISCSYFDFLSENSAVVSLTNGSVAIADFRENDKLNSYQTTETKRTLKTVSVHPTKPHYFICNGTEGPITLWDTRNLKAENGKPVVSLPSFKSTSSAFFSPIIGSRILSTSLSDQLKIYDSSNMDSINLLSTIKHNNHTGRWLTTFKANWLPGQEDSFVVGSMSQPRSIQFYSESGRNICNLIDDELSSVCSINVMHPNLDVLAGGNSSGRVYLFKS